MTAHLESIAPIHKTVCRQTVFHAYLVYIYA